jgi:hypothetical protein
LHPIENLSQMGSLLKNLIKTAKITCPDKVKGFQNISLTRNTAAECIDDTAHDLRIQLCNICKHFEAFSIAVDESMDVNEVTQVAVFIRGCNSKVVATEELLDLIPMYGTTTGEDIFCEVERLLQKYGLPLNELVCLMVRGVPALSGCKNGVIRKLNARIGRIIP